MLRASNICVELGGRTILHSVAISADPGKVTAIIGPNGSGKTTLMRALSGELDYRGQASLNGLDIASSPAWRLATMRGVLPQQTTLAFPFTVHEVVRLGLTSGVSATDGGAAQIVDRALERVDLCHFGDRYYQELSGGEQQRVQLARVLCQVWEPVADGVPSYLFLDEPVSSLDIKHQLQIMEIASQYARDGGGVLAVMHDLNLTAAFCDSVLLLRDGRLFAEGSPYQVLTPANLAEVYGCEMQVVPGQGGQAMLIMPQMRAQV